jgi:hypothetical protein
MNSLKVIILAGLLLLTACTNMPQSIWYQDIDELIAQHQYKKAIQQIKNTVALDKNKLAKTLRLAKEQHNKNSIKFHALLRLKEWAKAKHTITISRLNLPPHTDFSLWETQLKNEKGDELRRLETEQALAQANLLKVRFKQQDLEQRSHETIFNWFDDRQHLLQQKQQLVEQLIQLSTRAISKRDYNNAQKTYHQALEFDQQLEQEPLHQVIDNWFSEQNQMAIQKRQSSLMNQLNVAITKANFKLIIKIEDILNKAPFGGQSVRNILKKTRTLKEQRAQSMNEQADKDYRNGNIVGAITLWTSALELALIRQDIQRKLLRAKKVQNNLKKLTDNK